MAFGQSSEYLNYTTHTRGIVFKHMAVKKPKTGVVSDEC